MPFSCCDTYSGATTMCVAVVKENENEIALFDASGKPRTFVFDRPLGTKDNNKRLCFSTHGHTAADQFLTPCLDSDGLHGIPEEECFCGEEEPHLHFHYHNDRRCVEKTDSKKEADFMFLADLIAYPKEDTEEIVSLNVSEQLPSKCNAVEYESLITCERKHRVASIRHGNHMDYLAHNCQTGDLHLEHDCGDCKAPDLHGRLVLTAKRTLDKSIELQFFATEKKPFRLLDLLEGVFEPAAASDRVQAVKQLCPSYNTECCSSESCGMPDSKYDCCTPEGCSHALNRSHCCASESCGSPDSKHDCCTPEGCKYVLLEADDFCVDGICSVDDCNKNCCSGDTASQKKPCCATNACDAAPIVDTCNGGQSICKTNVRSKICCDKICCASEIPPINSLLESQKGVSKVMINVALKTVLVDHDPNTIPAQEIVDLLKEYSPSLKTDGATALSGNGARIGRSHFLVEKICCASEVPMIHKSIGPLAGIEKISVNIPNKMVYVDHDTLITDAQQICSALNSDRMGATVRHDGAEDVKAPLTAFVRSTLECKNREALEGEKLKAHLSAYDSTQIESFSVESFTGMIHVIHNPLVLPIDDVGQKLDQLFSTKSSVAVRGDMEDISWDFEEIENEEIAMKTSTPLPRFSVLLAGVFWIVSMLSFIGGNWEYLKYLALLSVTFGLPHIGLKAGKSLMHRRLDVNVLMFTAAVGAVALQEFTEAAAVSFLFSISEWLEVRATTRARNALSEIVNLRPDKANLLHPKTNQLLVIPARSVPVGALVSVKTGDKIPCDGVVVRGQSTVNESSLTGESRPVKKGPKDDVFGGTVNSGMAELMVRTKSTAENSAVARLIRLVEEAQTNRSETEKMVDEFAKVYTPVVIGAALLMCSIPWAFGHEIGRRWTNTGLVLMVVACPCALIIATPVAYVAGLAASAQKGILIKGGAFLEALGNVQKIAFDKTGTLTQGNFCLLHLECFGDDHTREETLQYLALVEQRASHPLAQAINEGVKNEGVLLPEDKFMMNHTQLAGEGITAEIDGKTIHVGNERLFQRLGLLDELPAEIQKSVEEWASLGGTVGFMSIGNSGIVCAYSVADAVRPEASGVLRKLKSMTIEASMLTGDNTEAALSIGKQVGLSQMQVQSQLLPNEKLTLVKEMIDANAKQSSAVFSNPFKKKQLVMMVGDGVNDAAALAIADVGVAMGSGAALAMETSDVTLLDSNLDKLVLSIQMGKRVIRKIQENVVFSLVVKAIVVGFTLAGKAYLWAAIASDVGSMLLVTLNGMMLLPGRKQEIELVEQQQDNEEARGVLGVFKREVV